MFSEIQMKQSTGVCLDDIRKLKETLLDADAVVIGAGAGGLSAAARLAHAGLKPVLVEALDHVGGRAATEVIDGFTELDDAGLQAFIAKRGLAMDLDDIKVFQAYFRDEEKRQPTLIERLFSSLGST